MTLIRIKVSLQEGQTMPFHWLQPEPEPLGGWRAACGYPWFGAVGNADYLLERPVLGAPRCLRCRVKFLEMLKIAVSQERSKSNGEA